METHSDDFERILQLEEFQDAALMPNKDVKPLMFVSVDGRPDEAPKNQQALAVWAREFENKDLDAVFVFTHTPGSSAYNPVERRMAPLSKDTAGIILLFDNFRNHLDASNKTIDSELEIKNFSISERTFQYSGSEYDLRFDFLLSFCSSLFLTFRQSKKQSIIKQNFTVPAASGGLNSFNTFPTDELKACTASLTFFTEYDVSLKCSLVNFGSSFKP